MTIKTQDNKASKLGAKLLAAEKHDKDKKKGGNQLGRINVTEQVTYC